MPKAVSSNSIAVFKIHPVSSIDTLHELPHALQAYKIMLEHLIDKAARQTDKLRKHVHESRENTKELRNKFFAEQLRPGRGLFAPELHCFLPASPHRLRLDCVFGSAIFIQTGWPAGIIPHKFLIEKRYLK